MNDKRFLTVTALTKYIRKKFDVDSHLHGVLLKGEISNFKKQARGHMYFTLKDENARILATMFSMYNRTLPFTPENGMKVLVQGDVTVYEPYGQYQINVTEMQPDGIGSLYLAYEELKSKLSKEGLFSVEAKKMIPKFPDTIGIVTSPTGAAIRDIVTTIKRRYPIAKIILIPAIVQGDHGAQSIVQALKKANEREDIDVLIVGRGGGSIEDLWSFNEEIVAQAIYASRIPVISAVGHETDFTISDFVSDLRAPTPTAAAELAVPHIEDLKERINQRQTRMRRALSEHIAKQQQRLALLQQSHAFKNPQKLYQRKEQDLDRLLERFQRGISLLIKSKNDKWKQVHKRMEREKPIDLFVRSFDRLSVKQRELEKLMQKQLLDKENELGQAVAKLNALNPLKVMERGYGLIYQAEDKLVKSIHQVEQGNNIKVQLKDGNVHCQVLQVEESENIE